MDALPLALLGAMVLFQAAIVSLLIPPARRRRMTALAWRNADLIVGVALVEAAVALVCGDTFYDGPVLFTFGSTSHGVHLFDLVAFWPLYKGVRRIQRWKAGREAADDATAPGATPVAATSR